MKKITRLLLLSMLVCLTAVGNIFVRATIDSVHNNETTRSIKEAPEGNQEESDIFLQPKTGKIEKVISSPIHYYPDQGKGMKATNKIKSTVTFIPKNPNEKVTLHINEMTISTSRFDVYSGKDDKGKLLFEGKFKTTARGNKLDDILSDSEDGALTIVFEAKNVRTIWDIEVKTVVPKDRAIESINAKTTISKDFKGSLKGGSQELLKLEVGVAGDINETSLGKVTFETSDNITSGKIYSTGVYDKFSASEEIATAEAKDGKCVFDLSSKKLDKSTNYYFWFVANISKDAKPEDVISAKLISADPAVSDLTTETATTKVVKGISGNFVIGNSDKADFKTIQEAFDSLKEGIDGPVVFAMEDGTYDSDNAVLQNVPGTSDNNTITLTSQSKDRKKVVIEGVKSNIVDYNSPHQGTITISNLNFLTINDLTFKTDDEKYTANILIKDHSNNITIDRCDVITTNQGNDIRGVKLEVRESYINNCNNFTLTNSYIEGGHIGVEIEGIGYVAETPAFNALVKNNVIKDAASKALYINSFSDFIIEDNQIEMKNTNGNTLECIAIVKGMGSDSRISRNKISIIESAKHISGICFRGFNENDNAFYRKNAHLFVDNNILHMKDVKANSMAIEFDRRSSSTNIDFVYNTVVIEGQECESSIALQMMANNKMENIRIINNIILNKANGFVYSMNGDKLNSSVSFSNNAVFAINKDHFAYFSNKEYTTKTFETWVEATGDKDSKVENVSFVNAGLFLPKKKNQVNFALPIKDVTTDITGTERDTNTPSVGAYEAKFNVPDNAPTLIKYAIENIKGESASFNVTADQMATISYMVLKSDLEAPSSEEIKAKGKKASLDSNKEISISIDHLEIETEYKVYAIITGALNQLETTPETLTFETIANPVETSNFDDNQKIKEIEGGFISGSNKFVGFEIAEDPNNEPWDTNQVAKMTGNEATIYVINTKKAIEQTGFFMANEKEVTITAIREDNLKGETVVDIMTVEPSDNEFYYIQSAKLGKVRAIKLQSQGEVYIDNFNGDPKPMQLIMKDGGAVKGQKGTVEVIVKDGLSPYTYEWENGTKTAKNEIVAEKTSKIKVKVTDAQGKEAEGFAYFVVAEAQDGFKVATFENLEVPEALYFNNQRFVDEQYLFNNNFNEAYKSWSGFAYTSAKDSTFTSWDNGTDQYNVVAKGGYNSEKYAVGYPGMPDGSRISVAAGDLKTKIKGTMMTLTAYTYTFFKEGQGDQSSVKEGDFFFVTIKGDNGNKKDVYLVDYRDGKKFMMTDWTWVDLSELGDVNTLTFSTTGSRKNDWGDVVPGYFAIDNFNCDKPNDVSAKVPFSSQVRAYLADGKIFVKDADGYTIKLHTMDGSLVNEFVAGSDDEVRDANLPEGTYIMVAHKGTEVVRQKLIMR